jgi:hypothetical protein
MDSQEKNLQEILEIVSFIKDNAATKEDLENTATKEDLQDLEVKMDSKLQDLEVKMNSKITEAKDEILTRIDGFIVLNQKIDIELLALRAKYDRLEATVKKVLEHLQIEI